MLMKTQHLKLPIIDNDTMNVLFHRLLSTLNKLSFQIHVFYSYVTFFILDSYRKSQAGSYTCRVHNVHSCTCSFIYVFINFKQLLYSRLLSIYHLHHPLIRTERVKPAHTLAAYTMYSNSAFSAVNVT